MSEKEVVDKYKGRLAVAALGAVPKELNSTKVRVTHDGSYSVDINRRIKVRDRLRFPLVDDAEAVLVEARGEVARQRGGARLALLYDVARAHKLIPVQEKDWGLQAFRMPGARSEGYVYLHTKGTFGVASAAYWWQRVAAGVVRLAHLLGGQDLAVLHLLFADDGWLTSIGEFFWRAQLYWFFILELAEVPLSWKKVKGGATVQWIGYQLDVGAYQKGISKKKVEWLKEWVKRHRAAGGVTGREFKGALGRLSFVAGALPHVRPFLGPLYAWSAVQGAGTCAPFPAAVDIALEYIVEEVQKRPMRVARLVSEVAVDVFRMDAKAEKDRIVLGAWESFGGRTTTEARWLAVELTRKSAPWAYVKGEPFRSISSLELTGVLVAVMAFAPQAAWRAQRGSIKVPAITDNLGNTYTLSRFMSCKFPLSIVVMELACQLDKFEMELDLGWAPRAQNQEADDLTNFKFEGFDMDKRIEVDFEKMDFEVLPCLMERAAELDGEIQLAKTSRQAKSDGPKSRGNMKWQQPW